MPTDERKWVAVDLDGCLAEYDGWRGMDHIGDPHRGVAEFLDELRKLGARIVVYTTRTNPDPFYEGEYRQDPEALGSLVWEWLVEHELDDYVDRVFTGTGKPIAVAYVDDRAVSCRPASGADTREFGAALSHVRELM